MWMLRICDNVIKFATQNATQWKKYTKGKNDTQREKIRRLIKAIENIYQGDCFKSQI